MNSPPDETLRAELAAAQLRVVELTEELDATNRGVVALHTELDAARVAEAAARAEQEVLAERDRIARDLQDQVIHRVFDAGLRLQGLQTLIIDPRTAQRVNAVVKELDATIKDLRTAIFHLHNQPQQAISVRTQFTDLIIQSDDDLSFTPAITVQGPIDAAVPDHVAADLITTTRVVLATLAGDRQVTSAEITLHATDDQLILRIQHNGSGATTSVDVVNGLRERARARSGGIDISTHPDTGTQLEWRVSLPRPAEPH